ncbi:polyprenyl synthetase family protein [Nocardioides ferulae]|uniref:polyprenyl synthetase family protein n=1 Tax=Nocardioides ferulae TaxID=2340821 RepID=UPI000EB58D96|nr:polyprenyl synthetase family protein [Nocardioides ferulae]
MIGPATLPRPRHATADWVQAALDRQLARGARAGGEHYRLLLEALSEASSGGKRLRPQLVLTSFRAMGGELERERPPAEVAAVAAAVELLHTAFVIHDDVLDGDDVRRGRPSAPGRFLADAEASGCAPAQARAYATAGAVLTGDLALAGALRAVATCGAPPEVVARLLDLFEHAVQVSAAGELADIRFGLGLEVPTLAEALTMEEHKTAVYSFALPMQCGAVLAGADESVVASLGLVGRQLGLAFQLYDDLLGTFGDPARTGKSAGGDLREGKQTPLVVHARTSDHWPEIAAHLGDPDLTEEQAAAVRETLEASGSRAFVQALAAGYLQAALAQAAGLGLDLADVPGLGQLLTVDDEGAA